MSEIREIRYVRTFEQGGQQVPQAEIELTDGTVLTALVSRTADGSCGIGKLIRKEADLTLDWYENPAHLAYEEIGSGLSDGQAAAVRGGITRQELERQVIDRLRAEGRLTD